MGTSKILWLLGFFPPTPIFFWNVIRLTLFNKFVCFILLCCREKAQKMSPMFNLEFLSQSEALKNIRHLVVVGENDSSEFKRQSKTYSQVSIIEFHTIWCFKCDVNDGCFIDRFRPWSKPTLQWTWRWSLRWITSISSRGFVTAITGSLDASSNCWSEQLEPFSFIPFIPSRFDSESTTPLL